MKNKKFFVILLAIFMVSITMLLSGCDYSFRKTKKLECVYWENAEKTIGFEQVDGWPGHGYIVLDGKKVDAMIGYCLKSRIKVAVTIDGEYKEDTFSCSDVNKNNQMISEDNVILFENEFGKIIFEKKELPKSEIDASEYHGTWESKDDLKIRIDTSLSYDNNNTYYMSTSVNKNDFKFEWIPTEQKFVIYGKNDNNEFVLKVAEGTYENTEYKQVTLNFTYEIIGLNIESILLKMNSYGD